ncbi:MAG: Peptidase propeptide and domain protein [Ilumatobacteraceae bacterium]|nr:Peptidase propeptide and domain protein [Ilumatobacteraceae bacterium]
MTMLHAPADEADEATAAAATRRPPVPRRAPRVRPALHRLMTSKRGPLVKAHRWLSFLLMLWIVLESLTGAGIVFAGEIDRYVNADQFTSTAGDVGMPAAIKAARESRPSDLVRFVTSPHSEDGHGVYWVYTTDANGAYHAVLVDPGTGHVNDADHRPPLLLRWAEEIHDDLNSTSIFGIDPLTIIGWMAVIWLVVLISGFYLWYWPGMRRWATALRVRRRRGKFTFHFDLHKVIGIVTLVPLTVIVITGINFAFPTQVLDVWKVATLGSYHAADATVPLSQRAPGKASITSQVAIDAVHAIDPSVTIEHVTGPGGSPVGVYTVEATVDASFFGALGGERTVEFDVDQYTGGIVSIEDPADKGFASQTYDDWSYQVHFGTFGGTTTKVLWVLIGLSPLVLAITGTRMWFIRRAKRIRRTTTAGAAGEGETS